MEPDSSDDVVCLSPPPPRKNGRSPQSATAPELQGQSTTTQATEPEVVITLSSDDEQEAEEIQPKHTTGHEVRQWLAAIDRRYEQRYATLFTEHGFDSLLALQTLDDTILSEMGVLLGHRRVIMKEIKQLSQQPRSPRHIIHSPPGSESPAFSIPQKRPIPPFHKEEEITYLGESPKKRRTSPVQQISPHQTNRAPVTKALTKTFEQMFGSLLERRHMHSPRRPPTQAQLQSVEDLLSLAVSDRHSSSARSHTLL